MTPISIETAYISFYALDRDLGASLTNIPTLARYVDMYQGQSTYNGITLPVPANTRACMQGSWV